MVTKVTLTHPDTDQIRVVAEQNVPDLEALGWSAEKVDPVEPEEPKAQATSKRSGSSRGKAPAKPATTKQEK